MMERARRERLARAVAMWTAACVALSCEQTEVRELLSGPAGEPLRGAARALISPRGLESIWAASGALELKAEATVSEGSGAMRLGPITQVLPIARLETFPQRELMSVLVHLGALQVSVPVRIGVGAQTVICRWQVSAQSALSAVDVVVVGADSEEVAPVTAPLTQLAEARVDPIGACPVVLGDAPQGGLPARAELEQALIDYTTRAISGATDELLRRSPLELFGLVRGELELRPVTPFESRRGALRLSGASAADEPALQLGATGLSVALDYAVLFAAASCAPRVDLELLPLPVAGSAARAPIDAALLAQRGADMGLSLSLSLLDRLVQAMARAGFMCRGLEMLGSSSGTLATRELLFDEVQINAALFGERTRVAFSPGELPRLGARAAEGTLVLRWDDLAVELYTEVLGVEALAARLTLSVSLAMRLEGGSPGELRLVFDTVVVERASLSSKWRKGAPQAAVLQSWARRALLLTLGDMIVMPLPLHGGVALRLLEAQVRSEDVVLLLALPRPR